MVLLGHKVRNAEWYKVNSWKYKLGMWVSWIDWHSHKKCFGVVLYRYNTVNKGWLNPATAILRMDGKVVTTQARLTIIKE